jgi:hypothetical protein
MKNTLMLICIMSLLACKKDPPPCKGCNIDTSPKTLSFTINGQILDKCSGTPITNKKIEWFLDKGSQSLPQSKMIGQDGKFEITYSDIFAFNQPVNSSTTSLLSIRIPEDSILFVLPATINFSNLILILNDSINCKINVEFTANSRPFTTLDTLLYSFEGAPNSYIGNKFNTKYYRKAGPFSNDSIGVIKDRIKVFYLDETGKTFTKCSWVFVSQFGTTFSSSFTSKTSKLPCEIRNDSVLIKL